MRKQIRSGLLFTFLSVFATGCAYLNANYDAVVPGEFYRSGQMHEDAFRRRVEEFDVQTVISLRSPAPGKSWYRDETAIANELGVAHYSLGWSKDRLPTPDELRRYVELVETSSKPILVHCAGGVHRSSVASAVYLLMRNEDMEAARMQLITGFAGAAIGRLLELYDGSEKPFGRWALEDYPALYEEHADS